MRNFRFWIPTIAGILLTPLAIFGALVSAGAGHGDYGAMFVLYPAPALFRALFIPISLSDAFLAQLIDTTSTALAVIAAILQFPLYGFILSSTKLRASGWLAACSLIVWLHLTAIALWLIVTLITTVIFKW